MEECLCKREGEDVQGFLCKLEEWSRVILEGGSPLALRREERVVALIQCPQAG